MYANKLENTTTAAAKDVSWLDAMTAINNKDFKKALFNPSDYLYPLLPIIHDGPANIADLLEKVKVQQQKDVHVPIPVHIYVTTGRDKKTGEMLKYTLVEWDDGDKTLVTAEPDHEDNFYFACCAAFAKKMYGNTTKPIKLFTKALEDTLKEQSERHKLKDKKNENK